MGFKMNGSPAKLGTIQGTSAHRSALKSKAQENASALKDEGHGGSPDHRHTSTWGKVKSGVSSVFSGKTYKEKKKEYRDEGINIKGEQKPDVTPQVDTDTSPDTKKKSDRMPESEWKKGMEKSGGTLNDLVAKRKTLDKGSDEWKRNQNKINEALGNAKRYDVTAPDAKAPDADAPKPTLDQKRVIKQEGKLTKSKIKVTKQEGKLAAKQADSEGGSKITGKERAKIKEVKLAGKVARDVQQGRTGLGSKIRKYRAARKLKKNIKKYGESGLVDKVKEDLTT